MYEKDLDWTHGRGVIWSLICKPNSDDFEDEPIFIGDMVIGLIADSEQKKKVKIIRNNKIGSSVSD